MKTELALSFIFDLADSGELERVAEILQFARARGVRIAGDLSALQCARKALAPVSAATGREHAMEAITTPEVNERGEYVGHYFGPHPKTVCPLCGREHADTDRGTARHRRHYHLDDTVTEALVRAETRT